MNINRVPVFRPEAQTYQHLGIYLSSLHLLIKKEKFAKLLSKRHVMVENVKKIESLKRNRSRLFPVTDITAFWIWRRITFYVNPCRLHHACVCSYLCMPYCCRLITYHTHVCIQYWILSEESVGFDVGSQCFFGCCYSAEKLIPSCKIKPILLTIPTSGSSPYPEVENWSFWMLVFIFVRLSLAQY